MQVPAHPDSRKYLRFVALNQVFQFKALCFGLSTAPQVFTRVMAPVSAILRCLGVRMCRYLDDWLISASSRSLVIQAVDTVVHLCQELGIVINWEKSNLLPSQRVVYLGGDPRHHSFQGFSLPSESREAMLKRGRILVLRRAASFFLADAPLGTFLLDSSHSGRQVADVIPSAPASPPVESGGQLDT